MANISQEKRMYEIYCTECGGLIEEKYFPLAELLKLYFNGETQEEERQMVINLLGVGAIYGGQVLPAVPRLLEKKSEADGNGYRFNRPDLVQLKKEASNLNCFTDEDGKLPMEALKPVELNIAAIVAQYYLVTGSALLYDMLERYYDLQQNDEDVTDDPVLKDWCEQFAQLQKEQMGAMSQAGLNAAEIRQNLETIMQFAKIEAERDDTRHFSQLGEIKAGWWCKTLNGRKMPYRLAVRVATAETFDCNECCCDKCHAPLPYELGAYRQKIVGLLGTQATGKTTYQAALADAIDCGEATSLITGNGVNRSARISIRANMGNDSQWVRAKRAPKNQNSSAEDTTEKSGAGPLWLYQNGYPVEKTPDGKLEAIALTFLISREGTGLEPVMCTLADIPGEAFSNVIEGHSAELKLDRYHALLKRCDALIMVVNSCQLNDKTDIPESAIKNDKLVTSPGEILSCYRKFLPDHAVPTAVVLTAADVINGGELRRPMQLAFDPGKVSPLVWSERSAELVYNAELMNTVSGAVRDYLNRRHGGFIHELAGVLKEKKTGPETIKLRAFAVSSGTQCAPVDYVKASEEYKSKEHSNERYKAMKKARFGVAAPLLWLLACDGMLDVGCPDTIYNDYPKETQSKIQKYLRSLL